MTDRRWVLNRKCFAVLRAIGETTDRKWRYVHCGPKGVTCTDTVSMIRVTAPVQDDGLEPAIFDYETFKNLMPTRGMPEVRMPEGMPAKTTGRYIVPNHDVTIPRPEDQLATITVDASRLVEILKAAMEVTEHSKNLVRLRFYKEFIRVDAHRAIGEQEFMGLLMWTHYNGNGIPGDKPVGSKVNEKWVPAPEDAEDGHLKLPLFEGRVFREVEEVKE